MALCFNSRTKWLEMLNNVAAFLGKPHRDFEDMPKAAFPAHLVTEGVGSFFPYEVGRLATPAVIELDSEDDSAERQFCPYCRSELTGYNQDRADMHYMTSFCKRFQPKP